MIKKTRNKFEKRLDDSLEERKKNFKFFVKYESEKIPYTIEGNYIPDWPVYTLSGKTIYIEGKGHFRREDKAKLRAVKRCHPELDIRLVFYSFSKTNTRWADRYGFKYSIGIIPDEWLL